MERVRPALITQKLFPGLVWSIPNNEKKVFITFDDGPTPFLTNWILEILKEYNAKATFFCLGKNAEKYPEVFNNILCGNHSIGNHSYSHLNGWKTNTKEYIEDVEMADSIVRTNLFRPPYGKLKPAQLRKLNKNYKIIMWDVLSKDYSFRTSKEKCLKNVEEFTKEGSIIVFHDSEKAKNNLIFTFPKVIKYLKDSGFECCGIQ
jgi:peptidoglycan-N-acetylglucosamine deacetylase